MSPHPCHMNVAFEDSEMIESGIWDYLYLISRDGITMEKNDENRVKNVGWYINLAF